VEASTSGLEVIVENLRFSCGIAHTCYCCCIIGGSILTSRINQILHLIWYYAKPAVYYFELVVPGPNEKLWINEMPHFGS